MARRLFFLRSRRRVVLFAIVLAGLGFVVPKLLFPRDIRPASIQTNLTEESTSEARRLLDGLVTRYGGRDRYRQRGITQVEYTDEWPSQITRRIGSPWQEGERLRFTFANGSDNSRLDFLSGPRQGQSWGIQQWQTYVTSGGQRTFRANKDIKFWLPTIEYFVEMAFRIRDAEIVAYAGARTLSDKIYDLVYLTWGSPAPQRHTDQYVAWIRRSDGILEFVEYTVRDVAPFITGCVHYDDLRDIDGILLPFRLTLGDCPGKPGILHRQTLDSARFPGDVPMHELVPEPDRRSSKSD